MNASLEFWHPTTSVPSASHIWRSRRRTLALSGKFKPWRGAITWGLTEKTCIERTSGGVIFGNRTDTAEQFKHRRSPPTSAYRQK